MLRSGQIRESQEQLPSRPAIANQNAQNLRTYRHLLRPLELHLLKLEPSHLREVLERVLEDQATSTHSHSDHVYEPQGYSFAAIHDNFTLSLHTWPEHNLATLDIITTDGYLAVTLKTALMDALQWREAS